MSDATPNYAMMIGFFELLLIFVAVGLLVSRTTRKFGLALVALAAVLPLIALLTIRTDVHSATDATVASVPLPPLPPRPVGIEPIEQIRSETPERMQSIRLDEVVAASPKITKIEGWTPLTDDMPREMSRRARQEATVSARQFARRQSEIVRNQRLQARMPDAMVHGDVDIINGTTLETYPDGMQIKDSPHGREVVRESDAWLDGIQPFQYEAQIPAPSHGYNEVSYGRTRGMAGIVILPLIAGVAFALARFLSGPRPAERKSWGGRMLLAAGMLSLIAFGFIGFESQSRSRVVLPTPVPVPPWNPYPPLSSLPGQAAGGGVIQGDEIAVRSAKQSPPSAAAESIESMFMRLTMPKINLEEISAPVKKARAINPEIKIALREFAGAAAPAAEPITEGWLVTAGKALRELAKEQSNQAQAMAEAARRHAAQAEEIVAEAHAAVAETRAEKSLESEPFASRQPGAASGGSGGKLRTPLKLTAPPRMKARAIAAAKAAPPAAEPPSPSDPSQPQPANGPRPRPEWIDQPPELAGGVQRVALSAGPYASAEECQAELLNQMRNVVLQRANERAQQYYQGSLGVPSLESLGIDTTYILRELCTDEFAETVDTSFGEMKKIHALLEFNQAQDAMLLERVRSVARRQGLVRTGLAAGSVLSILALAVVLLKVDTATKGYYSKRLFIGVPVAIIAIGGIALMLAMQQAPVVVR